MKTRRLATILTLACLSTLLALSVASIGTAGAQSATNVSTNNPPPKVEPVMTEELMARLIKVTRDQEETGAVSARICKALDLCDGTKDMPMKLGSSDSTGDGTHYFGVPPQKDSNDILIMVKRERSLEAYLTDKTGKLRAAAISENGVARLITNEKAAEKFKAELALFAKEAADLPPTGTAAAAPAAAELPQWRGQNEGDSEFSTRTIKTQESWSRFWNKLNRPLPQALDEARAMAVFIAIGERPTGGFKPRVVSATVRDEKLVVVYTDGKPSPDTFVTQVITHPWVIAIVPKTSLPVVTQEQGAK